MPVKIRDLFPAGVGGSEVCDRCNEPVAWITFGVDHKGDEEDLGVCACPFTQWVKVHEPIKVFRSVPSQMKGETVFDAGGNSITLGSAP